MDENWKLVIESTDKFDIDLKMAKLKEAGINAVLYNHQDSEFLNLNLKLEAGIYVQSSDLETAKSIISTS